MKAVTFHSETCYLLPYFGAWGVGYALSSKFKAEGTTDEKGLEARRAYASAPVSAVSFALQLGEEENKEFRTALRVLGDSRVLCPFWPAVQAASAVTAPPFVTGIWLIAERDLSAWEVNETGTAAVITPTATAVRVPLMLGELADVRNPEAVALDELQARIQFVEASAAGYALRSTEADSDDGPALENGITPKLFPLREVWNANPGAGDALVTITREEIGYGRERAQVFHDQTAQRPLTLSYINGTLAEAAALFKFFTVRRGFVETFWMPGTMREARLTAPTDGISTTIEVDDTSALAAGEWIAIVTAAGSVEILHVDSLDAEAGTVTLDAAPAEHEVGAVRIVSAVVARFQRPELDIRFITPLVSDAQIRAIEVPTEYTAQEGETIGVTHGALPTVAYLYKFSVRNPGGTIYYRFTSFDIPVTVDAEVFQKTREIFITHTGAIPDTLDFEGASVQIKSRGFSGNPLLLLHPNQLEGPLFLEILSCEPDSDGYAATAETLWIGKIAKPQFDGPMIDAQCVHILSELGRSTPTWKIQPYCNYQIYSTPCGVDPEAHTVEGTVDAIDGTSLTLSGLPVDRAADYFAYGRVYFGAGATYESRSIYGSTAVVAGVVTLTIDLPFRALAVAAEVSLRPGCDGQSSTCTAKFDNHARFGGEEYTPAGNPSIIPITQNQTEGGKK